MCHSSAHYRVGRLAALRLRREDGKKRRRHVRRELLKDAYGLRYVPVAEMEGKLYRVDPGIKIFRWKFMTAPGNQFDVRSAALKRIEAALEEAEICFAGGGPQTILVPRAPDPLRQT